MRPPRGLSAAEAALWARVARTVTPMVPPTPGSALLAVPLPVISAPPAAKPAGAPARRAVPSVPVPTAPTRRRLDQHGLDGSWERKLTKAQIAPDLTLDLHGHSLDMAHRRLDMGLAQAAAMHARLVLVITGKPRPAAAADRGERRGAIRAKILDWLAAGPHASRIAAVRQAHQRHGGAGALYVVLRRQI